MCCAELLTWQWDSEVSRRFQNSNRVRDYWTLSLRDACGISPLGTNCATVTQLLEIDCRTVWRELVNCTEGDLTPEMRDRIKRHLQSCPHCRAVYDGSRNIGGLLGDKNAFELPLGFSQGLYERLSSMH